MRASQVALVVKNPPASAGDIMRPGFNPRVRKIPWRRARQPSPGFLPGEAHGERSYSQATVPKVAESDMTKATQHAHLI